MKVYESFFSYILAAPKVPKRPKNFLKRAEMSYQIKTLRILLSGILQYILINYVSVICEIHYLFNERKKLFFVYKCDRREDMFSTK